MAGRSRRASHSHRGDDGSFPTFVGDGNKSGAGYEAHFLSSAARSGARPTSSTDHLEESRNDDQQGRSGVGGFSGVVGDEDDFDHSTIATEEHFGSSAAMGYDPNDRGGGGGGSERDDQGFYLQAEREIREEASMSHDNFRTDYGDDDLVGPPSMRETFTNEDDDDEHGWEHDDDDDDEGGIRDIINVNTSSYDDNPHRESIVGKNIGMKSPAVNEMNENAIFAKAAGLRYSTHGYDVQSSIGSVCPQDEDDIDNPYLSPRHPNHTGASHGGFFNTFFRHHSQDIDDMMDEDESRDEHGNELPPNATFLRRSHADSDDLAQLRLLAGQLSADWRDKEFIGPALARRLRDFQFAQEKRRKKYGSERPWGILGLYDHLASVRMDVEWAEDAAWRRANGEPYCAWSEFEASKNTGFNRPFFTYFILIVCTGVLVASIGVNGWVVEPVSVNPMIGPSAATLVTMGAKETYLIVNENQAWRLISPMVLHAGLIHYFLNMLALWFIGSAVEQSHGFIPALVLFIIPAIGGTVLSAIFLPEYISVGASGGIFGLIGACLSDIIMNWNLLFSDFVNQGANKKRHAVVLVLLFLDIVVNCLLGLTPFVDNFTHLGGMLFGFLCGLSTMERVSSDFFGVEEQRCWAVTKNIFMRFFGLIVSIASIMAATIILLEGDGVTNPCSSCSTLSCVTFPPWADQSNKWWYCDDCGTVTADARVNPSTGTFHQLDMTCPDGSMQNISLDGMSNDKAWLEANLPTFCRENCPSVHKS